MSLLSRILRRPIVPDRCINEAADLVLRSRDDAGEIRPDLLVDTIAAALWARDEAAATLDASNQEIIRTLKDTAGIPQEATVKPWRPAWWQR